MARLDLLQLATMFETLWFGLLLAFSASEQPPVSRPAPMLGGDACGCLNGTGFCSQVVPNRCSPECTTDPVEARTLCTATRAPVRAPFVEVDALRLVSIGRNLSDMLALSELIADKANGDLISEQLIIGFWPEH